MNSYEKSFLFGSSLFSLVIIVHRYYTLVKLKEIVNENDESNSMKTITETSPPNSSNQGYSDEFKESLSSLYKIDSTTSIALEKGSTSLSYLQRKLSELPVMDDSAINTPRERAQSRYNARLTMRSSSITTPFDISSSIVIIDQGSYQTRVGLSDQLQPIASIPSIVAAVPSKTGNNENSYVVGVKANRHKFVKPYNTGIVSNWPEMEALWEHCFTETLKVDTTLTRVLLTEPFQPSIEVREQMVETMFELFDVESIYLHVQPVLALFAAGLTTGCIIDAGEYTTTVYPVVDGYHQTYASNKLPYGGATITEILARKLIDSGIGSKTGIPVDFDYENTDPKIVSVCREVKEKYAYISDRTSHKIKKEQQNMFSNSYQLPDGTSVGLPNKDLETCYEVIFQPTLSNDSRIADSKSLPNAIVDSINDCAIDSRRSLINNVILAGGMSSAIGMNERLKAELKLSPTGFSSSDIRIRNSGVGVEGVSNAVWRGGSIITSLSIFDERWITSRDYDEYGPTIVHKMCPTYL